MPPTPKPTSNLRAAALIAASTYVTTALGFAVSIIIARSLGPHDYGQYAYLVWLSGLLVVIGNHGLGISGIRFISECSGRGEQDEARNVHYWLRKQQFVSVVAVLILFSISTVFFKPAGWIGSTGLLLLIIAVCVSCKAFYMFNISIAKGYKKFSVESWSNMIITLVYTIGAGVLALFHASLNSFAIFFALISVSYMLLVRYFFKKEDITPGLTNCRADTLSRLKPHLMWTIVLVVVATLSNKTMETLLLSSLTGPAEVGYFSISSALTRGGIDLLSSALTTMLMPLMSHAYGEGGVRGVNTILARALKYFTFLGLLMAGLGTLWSEPGILMMYGSKYSPVVDVLRVMTLIGGLTLAEGAFGALLSTTDNQKLWAQISIMSIVVSVVTSASLVPLYGLKGAVLSHAITRLTILFLMMWQIRRSMRDIHLPVKPMGKLALAAVLAATLISPLLFWTHAPAMELACGALFVVAYIPLTFWLGAWSADDLADLQPLVQRLPAPAKALVQRLTSAQHKRVN
ncbi:MAG: oligosaccharide flippase family protein [Aquabacterium sp.]|uniref:oligosaccharide flippase family protein n=1 Tax=Aquabacterium sp. TaxID=1872578 RepID=UPI0025C2C8DE|nr:oligosaccharide flippase family protein [Aquabacterium sp.]MBI3382743.1 oligosaccharide flippase family protein [Aquabacterium sp.]